MQILPKLRLNHGCMMKIWASILAFFSLGLHQARAVAGNEGPRAVTDKISQILVSPGMNVSQSVKVVRIADGRELFAVNPTKIVAPASVTKVITAAAALNKFGPNKTFKTKFMRRGPLDQGVIRGDIVVVGDGDPYLISEKLWQMAADFRNMGIREIRGNILIDNSLFDGIARDELRVDAAQESAHAYDAPVSALGVNFNTVAVAMAPGHEVGAPAFVNLDPYAIKGVVIDNSLLTASGRAKSGIKLARLSLPDGQQRITASGSISSQQSITKLYRSVSDHVKSSGETIRSFLASEEIVVTGKVAVGRASKTDTLFYELESYPLSKIVEGLNHFSNNYIADVLVKRLGAAFPRQGVADSPGSGTFDNGMAAISSFLRTDVGIKDLFIMKNGSGLTTENRLSADQICKVLKHAASGLEVFPEFLASLPAAGLSGTLQRRFDSQITENLKGRVRAKTGTLSEPISVSSLAGYVYHPEHGLLAFAILQNGVEGKRQPTIADLHDAQDRAISAFLKYL